jgi:hypothetical protein
VPVDEQPAPPPPPEPEPTTAVPGAYIPGNQEGPAQAEPAPKRHRSFLDRIFGR